MGAARSKASGRRGSKAAGTRPGGYPDLLELYAARDQRPGPRLFLRGCLSEKPQPDFDDKAFELRGGASLEDLARAGVGFACKKGAKSENQDSFVVLRAGQTRLYGVFDGHGEQGHRVANFAAGALLQRLAQEPTFKRDLPTALRAAFAKTQSDLHHASTAGSRLDCQLSGTTATLLVERRSRWGRGWHLCLAHVGDSRAVLGLRGKGDEWVAKDLTEDHKPGSSSERARILNAGGVIRTQKDDDDRVFVRNAMHPGLAMSRSLGDTIAHSVGVSSEPSVCSVASESTWRFVLLCSDGIWDVVTSQEAVDCVGKRPREEAQEAAQELAALAIERWRRRGGADGAASSADDCTALLAWLADGSG